MEITEPLTTLRELLEARLSCNLSEHEFYLQDSLLLDPTKNLVEQCVQGEGMVQINVEVKSQPGLWAKYWSQTLHCVSIFSLLLKKESVVDMSALLMLRGVVYFHSGPQ